ncbi:MAG: DNA polymerase III subunit epsilon [Leptospiraceae bacterium]|nr:MAG: DNA polymerase III subunit epsilon [Leptospiraceae bacterium]
MFFINKLKSYFWEAKYCKNIKHSIALCNYLQTIKHQNYFKEPHKNHYVVLDTETTGLDYKKDKVISIGAVRIENLEINISDSLEVILKTENAGNKDNIAVHGIRNMDVQIGKDRKLFFEQLLYYLQGDIVVGHHIAFDRNILSYNIKEFFPIAILNPIIDTLDLAIYYERLITNRNLHLEEINPKEYTLDKLIERYNIKASGRHTAIGDALITAELFLKLIKKLSQRKGFNIKKFMK